MWRRVQQGEREGKAGVLAFSSQCERWRAQPVADSQLGGDGHDPANEIGASARAVDPEDAGIRPEGI